MAEANPDPQLEPGQAVRDAQGNRLADGMYIVVNKKSRTNLDLCDGSSDRGRRVLGCEQNTEENIGNQLWIMKMEGLNGTFTFRNLQGGTFLDLLAGRSEKESHVGCWPREMSATGRANQEWRIEMARPRFYKVRCSRTGTVLEIPGGNSGNRTGVTCSKENGGEHQLWAFERISSSGTNLTAMLRSWREDIGPFVFHPGGEAVQYFNLPSQLRTKLWRDTGLFHQPVRPHLFDYGNFVVRMKDAVTVWAKNRFKAEIQGYAVLFGIIYGEMDGHRMAYNWYLSRDMASLVFFDAQSGREYGPAALHDFGFQPTFVLL